MRTFVSTDNSTFLFPDMEDATLCSSRYAPSIAALLEFAAYVREERAAVAQGPQLVGESKWSTLLLNGGFLRVDYDATLPTGAVHFLNELGERVVLREGGPPTLAEGPVAPEGALAGALVGARDILDDSQPVVQQVEVKGAHGSETEG